MKDKLVKELAETYTKLGKLLSDICEEREKMVENIKKKEE